MTGIFSTGPGMHVDKQVLDRRALMLAQGISIPPCPNILIEIFTEARRGDPDFQKICTLLGADAGLGGSILATVNSSFYGLKSKARSIDGAVMLLGVRNVTRLVTGLMLKRAFPVAKNPAFKRFWDDASQSAALCAYLANQLRCAARDVAYSYGLFRDCGMLAFAARYPDYVTRIHPQAAQGALALIAAERVAYRLHHAETGCELSLTWELPRYMCDAILHHHHYAVDAAFCTRADALSLKLVAVGILGDRIAAEINGRPDPDWETSAHLVSEVLGIHADDQIFELTDGAREALRDGD